MLVWLFLAVVKIWAESSTKALKLLTGIVLLHNAAYCQHMCYEYDSDSQTMISHVSHFIQDVQNKTCDADN